MQRLMMNEENIRLLNEKGYSVEEGETNAFRLKDDASEEVLFCIEPVNDLVHVFWTKDAEKTLKGNISVIYLPTSGYILIESESQLIVLKFRNNTATLYEI